MGKIDFSNIETTKASLGGNYIQPGKYILRIDKIKEGTNKDGIDFVAIEMTVFHTFEGPHATGENVTNMFMTHHTGWLGRFKSAIMGIAGCEEKEVTKDAIRKIFDEDVLAGDVVSASAYTVKSKKGNDVTRVDYEGPVEEEKWQELLSDEDKVAIGLE